MTPPPQTRRVLMTADTIGGVWTYALDLIRGLGACDVKVILATMGAPLQPRQREELHQLGDAVELHESEFRLEWMDDPWGDVAAAGDWLLALEREHQPDLIHLNGYAHAALPWHAPVLVVAHSCVLSWWRAVKHAAPPRSWAGYHAAVHTGLVRADLVVAPTRAMLDTLVENYGPLPRGRVIPNGRDPIAPNTHASRAEASGTSGAGLRPATRQSETGATDDLSAAKRPFIFSVGRLWDEAKNAQALAAVAPHLPWRVRLAGSTRSPDGGDAVLPNVELLGHCSARQLAAEYRAAGIYALPARYEPFGLSVLEAAHAGCALVLGDIASLRELWAGAALFVPPDDHDALQTTLLDLIQNPYRRRALGQQALRRAQHYRTARMTAGYLSAYAELIARSRAPRAAAASFA